MKEITVQIVNKSTNSLPNYETKGAAGADVRIDLSRVTSTNTIKAFGDAEIIWSGEAHDVPMVKMAPGSRALIPTGLYVSIPEGWQISIRPRSGLSIKQGVTLTNAVGLVDSKNILIFSINSLIITEKVYKSHMYSK